MKNKNPAVIIFIILAVLAAAAAVVKLRPSKPSNDIVKIIKPRMGDIRVVISSPGTVLPKNRLELKPPVNGRIEKVLVREGQKVKAGEILAWLSSTDRAALLDAARGQGEETLKYWQEVYKAIPLMAPIDGEVIVGTVQPGQTVTATDAVLVLSDHLIVRAQVDETDIGKVKLKQPAVITLDAYLDTRIEASVDHIYYESKTVNNVTVYEVDLDLKEVPEFFRSGMNTNVDFIVDEKKDVLLVSNDVIQKSDKGAFVFLHDPSSKEPQERSITLGAIDEKNTQVTAGLGLDDEIVSKTKKYSLPKNSSGANPFMPSRRPRSQ